jgi:hypothetical protein
VFRQAGFATDLFDPRRTRGLLLPRLLSGQVELKST